ncbi:hypothetical protein HDV00_000351 [Rhizophlyctis rosea]|nr:hypothetical protein HDV00_000351 [Rhizophlyctis rosea]
MLLSHHADKITLSYPNTKYGFKNFGAASKFKQFVAADGSIQAIAIITMKLPATHIRPSIAGKTPFSNLFLQEHLSDITLQIKDSTTDDITNLPAHKVVLACRSPYFNAMFTRCKESTQPPHPTALTAEINNFPTQTITSLLEFIYTNHLSHHKPPNLPARFDLIRAADYFQMDDLHSYVANEIISCDLNGESCLSIMGFANGYRGTCGVLAERVTVWVRSQWEQLVAQEAFREGLRKVDPGVIADLYE